MLLTEAYRGKASAGEVAARAERLVADGRALREDNGFPGFVVPVRILIECDSEEAIVWLDRGLVRARQEGDVKALIANLMFSCQALLRRGEPADAVLDGTEAIKANERWGGELSIPSQAGLLSGAQIEAGDLDGAERTLAPLDRQIPDMIGQHAFTFMISRAMLLLARGDPRGSSGPRMAAELAPVRSRRLVEPRG